MLATINWYDFSDKDQHSDTLSILTDDIHLHVKGEKSPGSMTSSASSSMADISELADDIKSSEQVYGLRFLTPNKSEAL